MSLKNLSCGLPSSPRRLVLRVEGMKICGTRVINLCYLQRKSPGIEFNTFSIVGRCARTGMLGVAITTSDLAVGSRCPYVMPGVGAVSTQAMTDPRLGPKALRLMEGGLSAAEALQKVEADDPHIER